MVGSVYGQHGQHVVRRVALVPSQGADCVTTQSLLVEEKTALRISLKREVANLDHVLVSNHKLLLSRLQQFLNE